MQGITRNSFELGRNTDLDSSKIGIQQYLEAYNVELVGDGKFLSLQNIKGTTNLQQISAVSNLETLAVFPNRYFIGGSHYNCLTIFTAKDNDYFKIWCYNIETDTTYELFQEATTTYLSEDRVIDAVNYPESGTDVIYFTDFYNEVRYFKCEIPSPYSANFLSAYDLSLARRGANGTIALTTVTTGGTLLSGTYQFAYRMANPTDKKFTKWSTLTNPIHVYSKSNDSTPVYSGVGMSTNRKITLLLTPSAEETAEYDFIQLAVVENVGPVTPTLDGLTNATTASLLEITPIPGTSLTFNYTNNSRIGTIPIEDITVDLAQINKVKTLAVKENRLFLGNIHYKELEFDNGTPSVSSGSFIKGGTGGVRDTFSSDDNASRYIGYWRGEVYRFGIVYTDKYGNKSTVYPLNLTGKITNNTISGAPDVKFPDRSYSNDYSLFNSAEEIIPLGLRLTGITGHPTWARSFEIVRVRRKKDILFQSPLIPMVQVYGTGALWNYPSRITPRAGNEIDITDAQPMTANYVYLPKNLMWPEMRAITKVGVIPVPGSGLNYKNKEEVKLERVSSFTYACLFPSPNMYGDTEFVYTGVEKIDYVDYALLKLEKEEPSGAYSTAGDGYTTNIAGNFYALVYGQYFFDPISSGKSIPSTRKNIPITDYEYFDNLSEPASVAGASVLNHSLLQTSGITYWQTPPSIQRMGVVKLGSVLTDVMNEGKTFNAGTLNAVGNNNFIVGSSGPKYEPTANLNNRFVVEYASFTENASHVQAIPIVNVKLGLGDDRYGDINAQHEYISTGAKYTFSSSEVATLEAGGSVSKNIDVWGGDCFVGPQLFKICDSTYSVMNQEKNNNSASTVANSITKWGAVYLSPAESSFTGGIASLSNNTVISMPIALENSAQYVQVVIESEYNGEVREVDTISYTSNSLPIYINNSKESIRTPLTYNYNLNLSRQNSQKIYFPELQYSFKQNEFGSRIMYSDLKIYNSDQAGFDIFRVGNIYDLEETYHDITKLAVAGDNLYAIQEQGIIYVPTGERQLEATDAGTLSVRSGDVIGRPLIIDAIRGSQHLRGIVETGNVIFIPDNINKSVYALSGQELRPIIENNETQFRNFFSTQIPEKNIIGIYNPVRGEYWLVDNSNNKCEVYNEKIGWVANYEFNKLFGGSYTNQNLYLIGYTTDTSVYSMYTGAVNQLFGTTVIPRVKFAINPNEGFSKTFDDLMFDASERLSTVDFEVERETSLGNQTVTGTSIDSLSIEGNFRLKAPRDSGGARLRGLRMLTTVKWKDIQSALKAVYTKFRMSARTPW